jgi:tetratricopeptide (TPR) repeat protein
MGASMKRTPSFSLLAALLLAGCSLDEADPRAAADAALAANDLRAARVHLISALKETPGEADLNLKLARVLVEMGDGDGARAVIERLPEDIRSGPEASGLMANALLLVGLVDEALVAAQAASEDSPRAAWVEIGALLATNQLAQGYAVADSAIERFPNDPRLLALRGEMALSEGRITMARELAAQAMAADPKSLHALLLSGRLDLLNENRLAARDHFALAAQTHPTVIGPMLYLAATEADLGNRDAAVATLSDMEGLAPGHPVATFLRAKIAFHDSDLEVAHNLIQQVESDLREMPQAWLLQGEIAYLRGNQKMAIEHLRRFLKDNPGHLHASLVLAQAYIADGDEDAAWQVIERPSLRAAASPQMLQLAARLAATRGVGDKYANRLPEAAQASDAHRKLMEADRALASEDWAKAAQIYRALREQGFANNALVLNNAAWAELNSGKKADALRLARSAYALTPDDPQVQDTLGWMLLEAKGDKAEALRLTTKALSARPTDFTIRWHHAHALAANGRKAEARKMIAALRPFGGEEQRAQLDAMLERL